MAEQMPEHVYDRWVKYYAAEPWDIPREFWPDIKRPSGRRNTIDNAPAKRTSSRSHLAFFENMIASGRVIDLRGKKIPNA